MARLTIHAGRPLDALLEGFEHNRSGRLNSAIERYLDVVVAEATRAGFTAAEWGAIFQALNGAQDESRGGPDWKKSWATVADADGLSQSWGVDENALAGRLRGLGVAGKAAVWEMALRYWAKAGSRDPGEFVARLGVQAREVA